MFLEFHTPNLGFIGKRVDGLFLLLVVFYFLMLFDVFGISHAQLRIGD